MEKDFIELLINYIAENLFPILGSLILGLGSIVTITWYVCKSWFSREIEHLKATKEAETRILNERINLLTQKLQDNQTYAKGIVKVTEEQIRQELTRNEEFGVELLRRKYETKLLEVEKKHIQKIQQLKLENTNLYKKIESLDLDKVSMVESVMFFVDTKHFLLGVKSKSDENSENDYVSVFKELIDNVNHDSFYKVFAVILLRLVTEMVSTVILSEEKIVKNSFNNRKNKIKSLKYIVAIFEPLVVKSLDFNTGKSDLKSNNQLNKGNENKE